MPRSEGDDDLLSGMRDGLRVRRMAIRIMGVAWFLTGANSFSRGAATHDQFFLFVGIFQLGVAAIIAILDHEKRMRP